jgi:hypothetical protein
MRRAAIATAVLFVVNTSANAVPMTLVCNGTVSTIRWDAKAPAGIVIEDRMEGDQWTVTIDTATKKLTLYPLPGLPPGFFAGEGDIKSISMQASIDADEDALKGSPWEDLVLPYDGSINRITGAFVVTVPTLGSNPGGGLEYSGNCKQAQPLF